MSWDISVTVPAGRNHSMTIYERNFTYNNGKIVRAALGGWCFNEGQCIPASEIGGLVARGIGRIEADRHSFEPLEPSNGWGGIDDTLDLFKGLVAAIESEPDSLLEVH